MCLIIIISKYFFGLEELRGLSTLGNPRQAIVHFKRILTNIPCRGDFEARSGLGQCYSELGQYDKAIAEYSTAIEIYNKISFVLFFNNPYGGSFGTSDVWGYVADLYRDRGIAHMALHDYDQAITDYTDSIQYRQQASQRSVFFWRIPQKHPSAQDTRYLRCLCYYAVGQQELAENGIEQLKKEGYSDNPFPSRNSWYDLMQSYIHCLEKPTR